jgi:hypothetical protein
MNIEYIKSSFLPSLRNLPRIVFITKIYYRGKIKISKIIDIITNENQMTRHESEYSHYYAARLSRTVGKGMIINAKVYMKHDNNLKCESHESYFKLLHATKV